MRTKGHVVEFESSDLGFVKKHGFLTAAQMALEHKAASPLPYLYDVDRLKAFLKKGRKSLFFYVKHADQDYRRIAIKKKSGGVRQVYAPSAELKRLQGRILHGLLVKLPVSAYATAYIRKKDPVQNALPHVGKRYLLKLDITDFFGSIRFAQVYGAAFHSGHFPKQVGVLLTRLCCRQGVLPQGAPTSPALSNLVLRNFDNSLGKWCASRGIAYTRYCDDMTFSSDRPLYAVYRKARGMLEQMGFRLNDGKTRFITNANRQSVTGLTVNAKVSVSRDYKRRLRQEVHYVLKFGLAEHILRSVPGALTEEGLPNAGKYYRSLLGRVGYVLQIEPENAWFRNAQDRLKSDSLLKGEIALWSM